MTLPKDPMHRLVLHARENVAIALLLLRRLMADELVDDPLIHASSSQAADEAMPQRMQSTQDFPLAASEGPLEVIVALITSDSGGKCPLRLAADNVYLLSEQPRATRMHFQPVLQDLLQGGRDGDPACGPLLS